MRRAPLGLALVVLCLGGWMAWLGRTPVPSAAPPGVAATADTRSPVEIRYQDVIAAVVQMEPEPALRLSAAQARAMQTDLEHIASGLTRLTQVQILVNRHFRRDQWTYVRDHRWTDLTHLSAPVPEPYASRPDPMKTVSYAISLLRALALRPEESHPAPSFSPPLLQDVSWFHVSQAVIQFTAVHRDLAFTAHQARAMLPLMEDILNIVTTSWEAEQRLKAVLTPAQKTWISQQKHVRAVREIDGRPIIEGKTQPALPQMLDVVRRRAAE